MTLNIDVASILAWFSLGAAVIGMLGWLFTIWRRFLALESHDKEHKELLNLLAKGQFATLDGLHQQGCNGEVTKAWNELRDHVIKN